MAEESRSETQPAPQKPGIVRRTLGALRSAARTFEIDTKPIPIDQIKPSAVASTIDNSVYNPLLKARFANGFDLGTVLAKMNYPVTLESDDYRKKHPEPYRLTRKALQHLVDEGALEMRPIEEPTRHGETIWYRVIDEAKLKEIAQSTSK